MSRRKIKASPANDDQDRVIVTTSRGVRLECYPVITEMEVQEEHIRAQFEWPIAPQRDISNTVPPDAGPEWPRTMEMSEEYVKQHATKEEQAVWAEYMTATSAVDTAYVSKLTDARVRLFCVSGVTVLDPQPEEEWVPRHEWLGMIVPENPLDRKLHYFRTEVLGTAADIFMVTKGIYQAAGVDPERLDEYEATFRGEMGRAIGEALGPDKGDTEQEEPGTSEGLVG